MSRPETYVCLSTEAGVLEIGREPQTKGLADGWYAIAYLIFHKLCVEKYKIKCQHQWESWEAFSMGFRHPYEYGTHLNFDLNKCKPTKGEKNHFQIFWHANMCFKCVIAFEKIIAWSAKKSFQLGIFFISGLSKSLVIIAYDGT